MSVRKASPLGASIGHLFFSNPHLKMKTTARRSKRTPLARRLAAASVIHNEHHFTPTTASRRAAFHTLGGRQAN